MDIFIRRDINAGIKAWENTEGAVLLDVRTKEEYDSFHIDKSLNLPLDKLSAVSERIPDKTTPLFVYCLSGSRSAYAKSYLSARGYTQVFDIGGINKYKGDTV